MSKILPDSDLKHCLLMREAVRKSIYHSVATAVDERTWDTAQWNIMTPVKVMSLRQIRSRVINSIGGNKPF